MAARHGHRRARGPKGRPARGRRGVDGALCDGDVSRRRAHGTCPGVGRRALGSLGCPRTACGGSTRPSGRFSQGDWQKGSRPPRRIRDRCGDKPRLAPCARLRERAGRRGRSRPDARWSTSSHGLLQAEIARVEDETHAHARVRLRRLDRSRDANRQAARRGRRRLEHGRHSRPRPGPDRAPRGGQAPADHTREPGRGRARLPAGDAHDPGAARQGLRDVHVAGRVPAALGVPQLQVRRPGGLRPHDVAERTIVFLDCGNIDRMPVDFLKQDGLRAQHRPPPRQHPLRDREPGGRRRLLHRRDRPRPRQGAGAEITPDRRRPLRRRWSPTPDASCTRTPRRRLT